MFYNAQFPPPSNSTSEFRMTIRRLNLLRQVTVHVNGVLLISCSGEVNPITKYGFKRGGKLGDNTRESKDFLGVIQKGYNPAPLFGLTLKYTSLKQ